MYMSGAIGRIVPLVLYFSRASCPPLAILLFGNGEGGARRGELGAE